MTRSGALTVEPKTGKSMADEIKELVETSERLTKAVAEQTNTKFVSTRAPESKRPQELCSV
ncbi:MAG TPA: hypothetical protein V6C86_05780 [Oculatellaceae cyanobacterium]